MSVPVSQAAKLLCDEMLMRLGHWLRAAGHDTLIADNGEADRDLLHRARAQRRCLLTRDRKLLEHRGAEGTVLLLQGKTLDEQARELRQRLAIDWQYRPFSRCLVCNTPVEPGAPDGAGIPADVDRGTLRHCPGCGRVYWAGSHTRRMRRRLAHWAGAPGLRGAAGSRGS